VKLFVTMEEYQEIALRSREVGMWDGHPQAFCRGELPFVLWLMDRFSVGLGQHDIVVREKETVR
jgi:hypothetical protein